MALCFLCLGNGAAQADDLRLRDGTVIKADAVWERDNLVWYQQGQIIRSLPLSEIVRPMESAKATTVRPRGTSWTEPRRNFLEG